eukprot:CAMPEP_0180680954 /NCGR_PEP_ID=MMETSP1037_2-20121125/69744_1 /TAXON_ID=632150 /ORGANISM="Azadinium spinosum, Strain 3D9" /LENGTH=189 /DNA_ID=CAMNT_0022710805 /DNA_START=1 /DNA_END=567 /DNA_ORIENTATION=+
MDSSVELGSPSSPNSPVPAVPPEVGAGRDSVRKRTHKLSPLDPEIVSGRPDSRGSAKGLGSSFSSLVSPQPPPPSPAAAASSELAAESAQNSEGGSLARGDDPRDAIKRPLAPTLNIKTKGGSSAIRMNHPRDQLRKGSRDDSFLSTISEGTFTNSSVLDESTRFEKQVQESLFEVFGDAENVQERSVG